MKKSNVYLILFFIIIIVASTASSVLIEPLNGRPLIFDKNFLNHHPEPGNLFVLKDTGDLRFYFKIIEEVEKDKFSIAHGAFPLNWTNYSNDIGWFRQRIIHSDLFDLENLEYKTTEELKILYVRGELEGDAVYKLGKNPLYLRITQSYLGYPILVLLVFLLIWLIDFIGESISRLINFPKQSRFYFLSIIGVLIFTLTTPQAPVPFNKVIILLSGCLKFLPAAFAFRYIKNKSHHLSFSEQEGRKFAGMLVVGTIVVIPSFYVENYLFHILMKRENPETNFIMDYPIEAIAYICSFSFLIWTAITTGNFLNNFRKHFQTLRKQGAKLKAAQKNELSSQAELDALQARINPHFLYNSLNSIASLAQIDPAKTEAMAMALSKFYKYSTNRKDEHLSSISAEIEILKTYLEIEEIRFGERLQFEIKYEKSAFAWRIPRFLIQPIVENAIKHGYDSNENNIKILVDVKETSDDLNIMIFDNGTAFPENMNVGYGLRSVQKKLKLLFPEKHELAFVNAPKKHVLIKIHAGRWTALRPFASNVKR